MKEILAEDISVGDIVYLEDNDMIPCDMVVLSTSQDDQTLTRRRWWNCLSLSKPTVVRSSQKQSLDLKKNHFDVIIVTNSERIKI